MNVCGLLPPKSTLSTRATEKINHTPSASTTTWKKKSISPVAKENEQQKKWRSSAQDFLWYFSLQQRNCPQNMGARNQDFIASS